MKRVLPALLLLAAAACSHSGGGTASQPGHGAITVAIAPNPIVAKAVSGNTYEFPFDIILRETGGHALTITGVTMTVYAFGLPMNVDKYDAAQITAMGLPTQVPANGEWRHHMQPRRAVTDERLFSSITAAVRIDAVDDTSAPASASTTVTVTR